MRTLASCLPTCFAACLIGGTQAQTNAAADATYEVATIKPHKSDESATSVAAGLRGVLRAQNVSLLALIPWAWGPQFQPSRIIGASGWITSEKYDIVAKAPRPGGYYKVDQIEHMMRALLADRFKLVVHTETREQPVFALIVAKSGSKLMESNGKNCFQATLTSKPGDDAGLPQCGGFYGRFGDLHGEKVPMSMVASQLARIVGRPVQDQTGLQAEYDVELQWTPETSTAVPPSDNPPDTTGPSIFTVLQEQLGLKLESRKGPVEVLVIDNAQHPSDN